MSGSAAASSPLTVLFTCVGRRIELMQAFRAAARRAGIALRIAALDGDASAPGLICADHGQIVPRVSDSGYVASVEAAVRKLGAKLLIPTTDTDLPALAAARDNFSALGCTALIGPPPVVDVCRDKLKTFRFLRDNHIDTPETCTPDQLPASAARKFPYFIKPRFGSASQSVHKIADEIDLQYYLARGRDPIVQEFVAGDEFTLDVYVGLHGAVRCVVPRLRWQVRGGEVSKGVVVKDRAIMDAGRRVVEALGADIRGVVTLQCIRTAGGLIRFIEINPRFGGGAPLSIAAGADFPLWLIQELQGQAPAIAFDGFAHGLWMERYDWSVFVPMGPDIRPCIAPPLRDFPPFE